jgi:putative ABC transport system permease protein
MQSTNPGFRPEQAFSFGVAASNTAYRTPEDRKAFFSSVYDRVASLPGVSAAGIGSDLPMKGTRWTRVFTPEQYDESDSKPPVNAYCLVLGRYFEALGIPLRAGRLFTDADASGRERVVIVKETVAKRFWPGQSVIGKRVKFVPRKSEGPWVTIVGVVGDVPDQRVDGETLPHFYAPYVGTETLNAVDSNLQVIVRSNADPKSLMAAVRAQVWALDRQAPISEMQLLSQTVLESESKRRLNTWLIAVFAATALALAAVGIYGVIAYSVTQRTQEIGIRMALGAERASVLAMVMRNGLQLAAFGIAIGVTVSLWMVRYIGSFLYQVGEHDLVTFTFVSVFLLVIAMLASYLPARRASRVDPMIALRYE